MMLMVFSLVFIATIIGAIGALLFKKASVKKVYFFAGLFLYGISTVFFIYALHFGELTIIYPMTALSYVWVSLLSVKFLGEKISTKKWLGIIFIICGVVLISLR